MNCQNCCWGGSKQQQRGRCFCFYKWVETRRVPGHSSFTTPATATTTATICGSTTSSTIAAATDATTTVSTLLPCTTPATTAARLVVGFSS